MKQSLALAILAEGNSVFLTGPAGSGKTYVLNEFVQYLRSVGKRVAVTASTGIAATHLSGNTIHSWAGIGIHDEYKRSIVNDMTKSRRELIEGADVLIIDEVSMLHDFRLDIVEEVCRTVRENEHPFGGLQVVLCGDFFQLPPINRDSSRKGGFVVNSYSWSALDPVVCYLEEQHRQEDDNLLEILTALRSNDVRRRHLEWLMSRQTDRRLSDEKITEIYTHNQNVDYINNKKLTEIEAVTHQYKMLSSGRAKGSETLKKSCLAPELLELKMGAFVMFVKNSMEKKYVNGTLGEVIGFEPVTDYPVINTKDGRKITAKPDTWELRDGEKKVASITQIPLRLAWAITIHKSQGMTLDAAYVDLSKAFAEGMGYVALSRVRSLDALILGGLNRTALMIHPEALKIDDLLRSNSASASKKFGDLEGRWEEIKKEHQIKKPKKDSEPKSLWRQKLDKMRQEYPKAYMPWEGIEDVKLLYMFEKNKTIKDISKTLGRHENSVRLRLNKHLGSKLVSHEEFKDFDFNRLNRKEKS